MSITKYNLKNNGHCLGNVRLNKSAFRLYCTQKKCSTIYKISNIFDDKTRLKVKENFITLIRLFLEYQQIS